jgi:hypothetical protein
VEDEVGEGEFGARPALGSGIQNSLSVSFNIKSKAKWIKYLLEL